MTRNNLYGYIGIALASAVFLITATPSHAAPAMAHDTCRVIGQVTSVTEKEFKRNQPQSWRDDWQLSESYKEIIVKLDVTEISVLNNVGYDNNSCTLEKAAEGYYLRDKTFFKEFSAGDCITAETNFSGDEFRIGNWIYNIEIAPADQCKGTAHDEKDEQDKEEKEAK